MMLIVYTSKMLHMRFVSYFTSRNALHEMLILSRVDQRVTAKIIDFEVFSSSFLYQNSLFFASKILEKTTSKKQPIFHRFSHQNWSRKGTNLGPILELFTENFWRNRRDASWKRFLLDLGPISAPLGASWAPLGRLLGASWGVLGASWGVLGASWGLLGAS